MWLALIPLAQLLHREILVPVEAKSPYQDAQPAKSQWPLKECQDMESQSKEMKQGGCVCNRNYQICQPLQLSATVNESVILPCNFTFHREWGPTADPQVHWRLEDFHSKRYLFNCCQGTPHTDPDFQGRVSLAREEGQPYTASIRITALRESDSQLYFCRVSVETKHGPKGWQTINGTNLTVTASLQHPEGRNETAPFSLGLLAGVLTGATLLAAAIVLGLVLFLLAQRKGHCQKRSHTRRVTSGGQEDPAAPEYHELPDHRGAGVPPLEKPPPRPPPPPGEPGLVYVSLVLPDAPEQARPARAGGRAGGETTYAAVRR